MIDLAIGKLLTTYGTELESISISTVGDNASTGLPKGKFTPIGGTRDFNDSGSSSPLTHRITLDLYGVSAVELRDILLDIRAGMEAHTGTVPTVSGISIMWIRFEDLPTLSSTGVKATGSNDIVARLSQDLLVTYRET